MGDSESESEHVELVLKATGGVSLSASGTLHPPLKKTTKDSNNSTKDSNSQLVSTNPRFKPSNKSNFKYSRLLRTVEATANFKPSHDEELSINIGDIITIHYGPSFGWCQGTIDNRRGWFPVIVSEELTKEATKHAQEEDTKAKDKQIEGTSIIQNKEKITSNLSRKLRKRATPTALQETYILQNGPEVSQKVEEVKIGIAKKERATLLSQMIENHKKIQNRTNPVSLKLNLVPAEKGSDAAISPRTLESYSLDNYSFVEDYTMEDKLIDLFASKPSKAIAEMIENKIIKDDDKAISSYLFKSRRLDKAMIGDYLGDPGERNKRILSAYLGLMNFEKDGFDKALRRFLLTFKLPGEAQKIDRIMEAFAEKYFTQYNGNIFKSKDAIYVLAFSTIMLNTDLHNPSITKKMEQSEFVGNNRGINDGEDLPRVFLEDLYQRINEEEIKTEETDQFPNAIKRGYLFFEKRSRIRGKRKLYKYWWILDEESDGLYAYKKEQDEQPYMSFKLSFLSPKKRQTPAPKQTLFPILFDYVEKKGAKPTEIRLLAGSQRLWCDWLSIFTSVTSYSNTT